MRIALAAHTILYLPLYVIRKRGVPHGLDIQIEAVDGDANAFKRVVRGESDACVCDPMVLAQAVADRPAGFEPAGKAVAALVERTGLWAVSGPRLPFTIDTDVDDLFSRIDPAQGRTLSEIVTYNGASTGGRVVEYLKDKKQGRAIFEGANIQPTAFGHELEELKKAPKDDGSPDIVVTCDLVGAIAVEDHAMVVNANNPPKIVQDFANTAEFSDLLFTVLIVSNNFLNDHKNDVVNLIIEIQKVLSDFYHPDRTTAEAEINMCARTMVLQTEAFPAVGPGKLVDVNDEKLLGICNKALKVLRDREVLARTVNISLECWIQALRIAGHYPKNFHGNSRRKLRRVMYFDRCCDDSLARRALRSLSPTRALAKRILSGITRPAFLLWNAVLAVAMAFQLAQRKVESASDVGLMLLFSLCVWLLLMFCYSALSWFLPHTEE